MTATAIALLLKPWLALAFFAALVIPLKLLILRVAPKSWHPTLNAPLEPWRMWTMWAIFWAVIILWALLSDLT